MRRIKVSYEVITEESARNADAAERGMENDDGHPCDPDEIDVEDGKTAVDLAVAFLRNEGVSEPSSSRFHAGVWYTSYGSQDMHDGSYRNQSYHLHGFEEWEEMAIFRALFPKWS